MLSKVVSHVVSMSYNNVLKRPDGPLSLGTDMPLRWACAHPEPRLPVLPERATMDVTKAALIGLLAPGFPPPTSFALTLVS